MLQEHFYDWQWNPITEYVEVQIYNSLNLNILLGLITAV